MKNPVVSYLNLKYNNNKNEPKGRNPAWVAEPHPEDMSC